MAITKPEDAERRRKRMERLPRVTERHLRGMPVREIAAIEGVTPRVIYKDLELAMKRWAKMTRSNIKTILIKELAKLDQMERVAWEQHDESCKNAREKTVTELDGARGKATSTSKTTRKQNGDPRWLNAILSCMQRRMELLTGEFEGKKEPGQMETQIVEVVVENPEQVAKIISYKQYEDISEAAKE